MGATPSWPLGRMKTGTPADASKPLIPAMKVAVCSPCWPMRMVFASAALPGFPMMIFVIARGEIGASVDA